jgi:RHS repeat-associated protein
MTIRNLSGTDTDTISPDPSSTSNETPVFTATRTEIRYASNLVTTTTKVGGSVIFTNGVPTVTPGTNSQVAVSYPDGRAASNTGVLQPNMTYGYSVNTTTGNLETTSSYLDGSTSCESTVTASDWAGRTVMTNKSGIVHQYAFFGGSDPVGSRGKVNFVVDADDVYTLYLYNSLGEPTVTALDINGNSAINYGTDQVMATKSYPASRSGVDVIRTVSLVWLDNADENSPMIASQTDQTPDGLQSWREDWPEDSNGHPLTTVVTTLSGNGSWDVTTTRDDGTISISEYNGGMLADVRELNSNRLVQFSSTGYEYDDYNRLEVTTESGTATTTGYVSDNCDMVLSVTDHGERATTYTYDNRGNRRIVDAPDTDGRDNVTQYTYDSMGRVDGVSGATYPISYTYDYAGRMKSLTTYRTPTSPAKTKWVYSTNTGLLSDKKYDYVDENAPGSGPHYTYTPAGRLYQRTWARNVVTTYTYDPGGRLHQISYNDNKTPGVTINHDALGRVGDIFNDNGVGIDYTYHDYDHSLDVSEVQHVLADTGGSTPVDVSGSLNREQNPTCHHQKTGYMLSSSSSNPDVGAEWTWDPDSGQLRWIDWYDMTSEFSYTYVPGSPGLVETVTGPLHWVGNTYEIFRDVLKSKTNRNWDDNVISKTEYGSPWSGHGFMPDAVNAIGQRKKANYSGYAYADNNRLGTYDYSYNSSGEVVDSLRNNDEHLGFEYDGIGNRLTTWINGSLHYTYTSNALNQYTAFGGLSSITYDADGNLEYGGWTYVWDAENRLIEVRADNGNTLIVKYDYDPLGRRVRKTTTSTPFQGATQRLYYYDGWNLIAEYDVSGSNVNLLRAYMWGLDLSGSMQGAGGVGGLLAIRSDITEESATVTYPLYDGNGNVTQLIADDGNEGDKLVAHYEYSPFGRLVQNIDADSSGFNNINPFRFSTKYYDEETDFYYYGYRYYQPWTGRWLSRDPIEEKGGKNLYGFVGNDGNNRCDYLGYFKTLEDAGHAGAHEAAEKSARFDIIYNSDNWTYRYFRNYGSADAGMDFQQEYAGLVCCNNKLNGDDKYNYTTPHQGNIFGPDPPVVTLYKPILLPVGAEYDPATKQLTHRGADSHPKSDPTFDYLTKRQVSCKSSLGRDWTEVGYFHSHPRNGGIKASTTDFEPHALIGRRFLGGLTDNFQIITSEY